MSDNINSIIAVLTTMCNDIHLELNDEVRAVISQCTKVGWLMLEQVLNRSYYPSMTEDQWKWLIEHFTTYVVINGLYFYLSDRSELTAIQKKLKQEINDYCVNECLLYVTDENSMTTNITMYLLDTFYNIH